jgi:hypothetical protein
MDRAEAEILAIINVDPVDRYFEMDRAEAEILAILWYEGDRPVTENPEDFERFERCVQKADDYGFVETPSGEEGDWVDFQSYYVNGSREVRGFVPVLTDSAQQLFEYEEWLQSEPEPSYLAVGGYSPVIE